MVKKQGDDWRSVSSGSTNINIKKYIELCKEWLVVPDNAVTVIPQFCNVLPDYASDPCTNTLGLSEPDIRTISSFECFICSKLTAKKDGKSIVANPFTRAQFMLVCNECK